MADPGFYNAVSGMLVYKNQIEAATANISNEDTPGYKCATQTIESMPEHAEFRIDGPGSERVGKGSYGIYSGRTVTDFSQGELWPSDGPLDFAVNDGSGKNFFRVFDEDEIILTRDGKFRLDNEGYLVLSSNGNQVMGADGAPIQLESDQVALGEDGTLVDKDGQVVGEIGIWSVEKVEELERTDFCCFIAEEAELVQLPSNDVKLCQRMLESSNGDNTENIMSVAGNILSLDLCRGVMGSRKDLAEEINGKLSGSHSG
ncbi:flagellar basal-body rod protein FlgF [Clostridia bacterium]|nr:flagellar basal-body rod protein FlgF [Clostridia bacterium]